MTWNISENAVIKAETPIQILKTALAVFFGDGQLIDKKGEIAVGRTWLCVW